ncbi:MAG: hypothetical protein EOP67_29715, partial [Sphingomonas sp.]
MRIVIATGGVMPILLGCGLGGCSDPKQQQLDVTAAAARAQQNIARYAADSRPGRHPVGTTKIAAAAPETLPEAAAAVVRRYYQRIAAHDFVGARALWCRDGESSTLDRAGRFLALVGLLSAMLAAVAVAMAARRFMQRHLDACAMLRCLGMTQNQVGAMYL